MAYEDIPYRGSYEGFMSTVNHVKPYRGRPGDYPLGKRAHSSRYFHTHSDGRITLHLGIGHGDSVFSGAAIATIRPDNTIEFHYATYSQYGRGVLSRVLGSNVRTSSAHDGMTLIDSWHGIRPAYMHPLFRGLRLNLRDATAAIPYELSVVKRNRKAFTEALKEYDWLTTAATTMIDAMRPDDFEVLRNEVRAQYKHHLKEQKVANFKELVALGHYVDAAVYLVLSNLKGNVWRYWGGTQHESIKNTFVKAMTFESLSSFLFTYKANPELFTLEPNETGSPIPSAKWGYVINTKVEQ